MVLKRVALLALLYAVMVHAAWASPPPSTPWEDSGHFTTLTQLDTFLHRLAGSGHWKFEIEQAGQSSVAHLPIWAVHLTPPGTARYKVLVLARVHGNEPAATEAALSLIRDVATDSSPMADQYRQFEFLVVPCVNPEGAQRALAEAAANDGWWGALGRDNAAGVDINRDYLRLSSREARTVVSLYDSFKPTMVFDLHEYEARPLVAGDGWWRAEYWDLLVGAGRAPWAGPSLRTYCRSLTEEVLFPAMHHKGLRAEHYMLPSGSFDSSMHFASNAADYFLVRGTPAFLLESAGGDGGESTGDRRVKCHRVAMDALLSELSQHPEKLQSAVAKAAQECAEERQVTLQVTPRAHAVKLQGTDGLGFGFESHIDVGGKTYHAHQVARFEGLDYDVKSSATLPSAFLIQTRDPDYLYLLQLHGLSLLAARHDFTVDSTLYPAGTVVVSANSPLVGLLLLKQVQDLTPNHLPTQGLVAPAPNDFHAPEGKPVVTMQDCVEAAQTIKAAPQARQAVPAGHPTVSGE